MPFGYWLALAAVAWFWWVSSALGGVGRIERFGFAVSFVLFLTFVWAGGNYASRGDLFNIAVICFDVGFAVAMPLRMIAGLGGRMMRR